MQQRCKGLCAIHYQRLRKRGELGPVGPLKTSAPGLTCTAHGCSSPTRSRYADYCETHYYRLRRNGSLEAGPWHARGECAIDGCEKPEAQMSMCEMHHTRQIRHGDPHKVVPFGERRLRRGADHPMWISDEALDYRTCHRRLRHLRGSASQYPCASCDHMAVHWSYDHLDPDERTRPDGVPFSISPDHYQPRCASCHKILDHAFLRREAIRRALAEAASVAELTGNLAAAEFVRLHLATAWPQFPETTDDLQSGVGDFLVRAAA